MPLKQLRLTVWKPLRFDRRLAWDGEAPEWPLVPGRELYVEAYRWPIDLDVWGSADQEVSTTLRDALVARFDPFKPSKERRFDKLRDTLRLYEDILGRGGTSWRDCEQAVPVTGDDDDGTTFRANTVRALWLHLRWVHATFHTLPSANLTVR